MITLNEKIADIVAMVLRIDLENLKERNLDEPLNTIGMDSLNCMDIVVSIEEEFNVTFNDEELLLDSLNSINKISTIVAQKLEQLSLT